MAEVRIAAEPRTEFGKGAARRVRRADKVPGVIYGHGRPPRHISLSGHALMMALKGGANTLLRVEVDGGSELALPKSVARDPIKGFFEHIDLLLVRSGEKVDVEVPLVLTGEAVPDGLVDQQVTTLSVQAEATHIPAEFEISIEGLDIGDAIHAGDVALPSGVVLTADPEGVVVHVMAARTAGQVEGELESAEAELGAAAAGAQEQEEAKAEVQGEAARGEPTGEGDVVPDTESGSGGPGGGPGGGQGSDS